MSRWWISWWSGNYADEGCTKPPFQFWCTGSRDYTRTDGRDEESYCALVDAESEERIWDVVKKHYPDYEQRFCTPVASDFQPNDRFQDFQNRTQLFENPS